jgi:hypothetical protein
MARDQHSGRKRGYLAQVNDDASGACEPPPKGGDKDRNAGRLE